MTNLTTSTLPQWKGKSRRRQPLVLLAGVMFLLGGCTVGPNFAVPDEVGSGSYRTHAFPSLTASADIGGGKTQTFVDGDDLSAKWWRLFKSPKVDALVELALKANPSIPAAEAALKVAQENTAAQAGAFLPSVTTSVSPTRQGVAGTLASPSSAGYTYYNLHTAQLNISYVVDVFGGNRRQVEAQRAQADYQFYQLKAAQVSLVNNVIGAAVQIALLRAEINATHDTIALSRQQLSILKKQLALGAIPEVNVISQEALEAQAVATLPPLQKQLAQQVDLIAALTGRLPSEVNDVAIDLDDLDLPETLPLSLPSKVAQQRPDILAAQEQLHVASAQIGVATANMLPQITLNAGVGSAALNVGELFKAGTGFWNLAGGLTQPLFEGGTLLHRKRAAQAAYEQTAYQYRSTVLSAFQNIADTLFALRYDAQALSSAAISEKTTRASLEIARRQVELGDVSYLSLLPAEQNYQQVRMTLLQARANRFIDTAALFQAIGGGWWNDATAGTPRQSN